VNAKSILSLLMLAIKRNSQVKVNASGIDAEEAINRIEEIIAQE
jgi:phosphotransferase system HPr (HPr) family protein